MIPVPVGCSFCRREAIYVDLYCRACHYCLYVVVKRVQFKWDYQTFKQQPT